MEPTTQPRPLHDATQDVTRMAARDTDRDPVHDATRRKFLGTLTGALAAGLVVQIIGCTESDFGPSPISGNPEGPGCPTPPGLGKAAATSNRTGSVSDNHGHVALLTAAVQDAGAAYTLHIEGTAGHDHTIALTAQEMSDLKAGRALTKTSSNVGGHTHDVTFALVTSSTPNKTGDVGDNHGHEAVVTGVVQDAGTAYALHIEGNAGHDHTIALTAQEVMDLKNGTQVSKTTAPDGTGHTHTVTFAGVTSIRRPC